jgi:hypothetical protein
MTEETPPAGLAELAEEFDRRTGRTDGLRVASGLTAGLTLLRRLLYLRLHEDVERIVGRDSMLMPVSEKKVEVATKIEIELYQIAESAAAARESGYLPAADDWFRDWLVRLRLGQSPVEPRVQERVADYLAKTPDARRLAFSTVLARTLAESRRAPLVLFHLFPLSVRIATALAFGDAQAASEARSEQVVLLPAIGDCRQCRGRVLEGGEQCPGCGNPLWKSECLTATD